MEFIRAISKDVPIGGVCINDRFVYTMKYDPKNHVIKTESYVDG